MKLLPSTTVALLAALAACATPPDHFHTLRPASDPVPAADRAAMQGHVLAVGPVTVPDALARDEWVIRTGGSGARVVDHQLWTQPLGADIAQALVDYLGCSAHVDRPAGQRACVDADAGPTGSGSGADLARPAPLRVRVQVLRFDARLAPEAAVADELRWTLECLPAEAKPGTVDAGRYRVVRSAVRESDGPAPAAAPGVDDAQRGFDRIALAHSETLRRVAADIAAALADSAAERARSCVDWR